MSYCLKTYAGDNENLLAVCDAEIVGISLDHKGIKIKIDQKFYGSEEFTEEEVLQEIVKASSINAMGANICELLIQQGLTHPATILWFNNSDDKIGHVIVIK